MYFKLRFLQYIKKILVRDLILKGLFINPKTIPRIKNIELYFKSNNYIRQSQYLNLLSSLELFFTQKPKIFINKNKIKIKLTLNKNFQLYNNLNLLATINSTSNKIKIINYGLKNKYKSDLFLKNANLNFLDNNFSNVDCQISVSFNKPMQKQISTSLLKSIFLNLK